MKESDIMGIIDESAAQEEGRITQATSIVIIRG